MAHGPRRAASLAVAALATCALHLDALRLEVNRRTGAFTISSDGETWFRGGEYRIGPVSSSFGHLVVAGSEISGGTDRLGRYMSTTLSWSRRSEPEDVLMQTSFREYAESEGIVVFEQYFPLELDLRSLAPPSAKERKEGPVGGTLFPSFFHIGPNGTDLPCVAYHGVFASMQACTVSTYDPRGQGVPLVVYDPDRDALPMAVLSPLNNPMATSMYRVERLIGIGLMPTIEVIPRGTRQHFIVSAGVGINAGMMAWGDSMLQYHGQQRVDNRYRDDVHGCIGFWTDNGGYYHYSIGSNRSLGSTYEEVLPKVKAYHDSIGVPFRHWQFDSWFYPKDGPVHPGGGGGAVVNWTAMPSVFPSGMAHIQAQIGLPMVMHNRQWSTHSDYLRNWPDIEWYVSERMALPKDPATFFERFFRQQEGWGLAMYEQDWMVEQFDGTDELHTNISLGDLWLRGMASGAAASNRTVQYCMPLPNQVLTAAALPAVTNIRASDDYAPTRKQWNIGGSALLLWALGKLPFKDGFYSSTHPQVGGQTVGPELHPDRAAIMATLSCAMVGPMDGIYLLNASRVMATCRGDGVILKPDRPATVTDACFRQRRPTCDVFETFSEVPGVGKVHYYFADDAERPLLAEEVYVASDDVSDYAVYNWYTRSITSLQVSLAVDGGYEGHIYAVVTPIQLGWVFVGEADKYVTASTLRFRSVSVTAALLIAEVLGTPGELVTVCVARSSDLRLTCQQLAFQAEEARVVTFSAAQEDIVV